MTLKTQKVVIQFYYEKEKLEISCNVVYSVTDHLPQEKSIVYAPQNPNI